MRICYLAFSEVGFLLAEALAKQLGGVAGRCEAGGLKAWTREGFETAQALVFVGAVGIAVRAIAPYVQGKTRDPAVLVVDELGSFVIPILSGHLGGANALARRLADCLGATAVITTATDLHGCFALDLWAKRQNCAILHPERIKCISARLLAGESVRFHTAVPIAGLVPSGLEAAGPADCDVLIDYHRGETTALQLVPRALCLGLGARRGISLAAVEDCFARMLLESGLCAEAITCVSSIDLKAEEPALLDFCKARDLPFVTYSAVALSACVGSFAGSDFVKAITGVDNVCERAAVLTAGAGLVWKKTKGEGVTMALAVQPLALDWSWQDG